MGFWDSVLQVGGGIAGGVGGFMVGGPAGAMAGYGLGSSVGGMIDQGLNGGGGLSDAEQQQLAWLKPYWQDVLDGKKTPSYVSSAYDPTDPLQQKQMQIATTGLSSQDQLGYANAALQAGQLNKGAQQAVLQRMMATGGSAGASSGGNAAALMGASQNANNQANMADLGVAANAQQARMGELNTMRGQNLQNAQAINDFNQKNYTNYLSALGGASGQQQMGLNAAMAQNEMGAQQTNGILGSIGSGINAYMGNKTAQAGQQQNQDNFNNWLNRAYPSSGGSGGGTPFTSNYGGDGTPFYSWGTGGG